MNLLNRVQRVLGVAPTPRAYRPWLAGALALLAPVAIGLGLFAVAPTVPADENKEHVTGTLVDQQGNPVPGAVIRVLREGEPSQDLRSDSVGQFKVPKAWRTNPKDSLALIVKDKNRLAWFDFARQHDEAGQTPDFRIVLVPRTREVQGELVDETGVPLADFPVGVENLSHKINGLLYVPYQASERYSLFAKTDAAGRFRIKLPEASADLRLLHPDRLALRLAAPEGKASVGKVIVGPAGRVEGRVTDAKTGKPLAKASVGVQLVSGVSYETGGYGEARSNADGRFVIGGLLPGQYNALFWGVGENRKLTAPGKEGVVVAAGKTMIVNFQVSEGRRLAGKVVDVDTGKPLARYSVGCYGADRPRSGAACSGAVTDEQGRFELFVSPGPTYIYVAQGPQMSIPDHDRTIEVTPDRDITDLVLQATTKSYADLGIGGGVISDEDRKKREENQDWRLRIRLRPSDGRQVNGVTYHWIRGGNREIGSGIFSGNKYDGDAWGENFKGVISLLIDADGFAPVMTKPFEYSKRMEPLVVDLQPAIYVPVRGRMVDSAGKPLAGMRVRAGRVFVGRSQQFPWGSETATDTDGKFELKRLRVGERLFVYADKRAVGGVQSPRFVLEKNEPMELGDLRIPQGNLPLEGSVTDNGGAPVAGAVVHARDGFPPVENQAAKLTTTTDAEGQFRLQGLLPGKVWLQAAAPGYRMWQLASETTAGRKNVHVYLQRIPDPKQVFPTLKVELRPKGSTKAVKSEVWWLQIGKGVLFSTTWDGNENVVGFDEESPPNAGNTYALALAPEGFAWPKPVLVKPENIDKPVVIDLEPAAPVALRGRVVDEGGRPLAGVKVGLSRTLLEGIADDPWRYWREEPGAALTDAEGRFRIANLQPGCQVAVYVNKPGYAGAMSARTTLIRNQDTTLADIRLEPSQRTVTGVVVNAQGQPVGGVKVTVVGFGNVTATTGADGRFQLAQVPHGEIYLIADAEDFPQSDARVKADENQVRVTLIEDD
jgi:protocatechuate 3,4-dioxygenase beta subunit